MHMVMRAVALPRALELVEGGAEEHGAGGAERVAEGDGAAVDVDALGVDAELLDGLEDDDGEGLVDLPEVDVLRVHAGHAKGLLAGGRGRR